MTSRRARAGLGRVSALALVVATATLSASPAAAVPPAPSLLSVNSGIDISFPQCSHTSHVDLPPSARFAVVGVNGGSAFNANPCFSSEFNSTSLLEGATEQPHTAVYVNTGNPALAGVWWPKRNRTRAGSTVVNPNGSCDNLPGAACAYVYGYSMAEADYRRVHRTLVRMPGLWWLDVETSNTWQSDVVANAASLSGMVDYFTARHLDVGLYSTSYQWNKIAGVTPATSDLAGLPSWLAGGSYVGAPVDCEKSPLTINGRVAMVQYVGQFDNDYSCHRFQATTATISPASQSFVGSELTGVTGEWAPAAVSYAYQWNRNGSPIPGATSTTYLLTALDADSFVTVTITGFRSGYSTASKTSTGVDVLEVPAAP